MKNYKTIFITSTVLLVALFLSGCKNNNSIKDNGKKNENKKISQEKSNLENFLNKKTPVKCVMNIEGGKSITYINGNEMQTETTINGQTMISLIRGKDIYSWKKGDTKGQKLNQDCMKDLQKKYEQEQQNEPKDFDSSIKKIKKEENAGKITCSPTTKTNLNLPSNINFTDQCELMKKQLNQIREMQEKMKNFNPSMK